MGHFVSVFCSRLAFRLALTGAAAAMLAGCSSSERLSDPFSNPFQTSEGGADPAAAASLPPSAAAPISPVQSRPLGAPAASAPVLAQPSSKVAVASPSRPQQTVAGWSVEGGSPIVIAQGETGEVIARRYGVPLDALVRANGFASASQIQPGARIVIPVYNAALAASSGARTPTGGATGAASAPAKQGSARYAEKAKLLKGNVGATKMASAAPPPAAAAPAKVVAPAKPAPKIAAAPRPEPTKPQTKILASAAKSEPPAAQAKAAPQASNKQEATKPAKVEAAAVETKKPAPEPAQATAADSGKAGGDSANPEFRWPARGRIIQAFKPGGNDGINIAVPEGTSVKAAESGVVAYAGNELKGYGNLILIRHPNGFVSAYANNGDIEVKRGDTVKRGQTIAKSGQSGNVASPQLHFELRKGATPVDPTQYLAGL